MSLTTTATPVPSSTEERPAVRILLVERQQIFRDALQTLLGSQQHFAVVGATATLAQAQVLITALQPDIVVTDLSEAESSCVQHIQEIHARFPRLAILVLTAWRAHHIASRVRKAGALAYLLKDHGFGELLVALREATAGRWYCCEAGAVVPRNAAAIGNSLSVRGLYLTQRQRQVLRSVALGYRSREIAQMLGVSVKAVYRQRERLRTMLQLDSTAALTRFALSEGYASDNAPLA